MARCEETGPQTKAQCTWYTPHANHSAGDEEWPNEAYGRYYDRPKATSLIKEHRRRAEKPDHVDPAKDPINRRRPSTGVPIDALAAWDKDVWVEQAKDTIAQFLRTHHQPFTTPEDCWPLLDAPHEMRAMVIVVQRLVKAGLMREVDTKRLRGVYRTRDGREFAMNKIVPVYQSTYPAWVEAQASSPMLLAL